MTDQQKKTLLLLGIGGVVLYAMTRNDKPTAIKSGSLPGTMTNTQLAEIYKNMMSTAMRYYYDAPDLNDPSSGTPEAVELAKYTKNYKAVATIYKQYYGGDLSQDLITWFSPIELSQYVHALLTQSGQVMS